MDLKICNNNSTNRPVGMISLITQLIVWICIVIKLALYVHFSSCSDNFDILKSTGN